jgi:hypothetical protein
MGTTSAPSEPATMRAEPQKEHQWLQKLVGEWTYEADAPAGAGKPSTRTTGTESVRSLGGLWVVADGRGKMPDGGPATMLLTLGYDPQKKRYVGTWLGSMMTHLWVYDGELDATGRVLTLNSQGPSMSGDGGMTQYKDVIDFKSDDHRTLTGRVLDANRHWQTLMTADYRRKKT